MHDKTLLYGALGVTALATILAVTRGRSDGGEAIAPPITKVSLRDASGNLREAEVPIRLTASDGTGLRLVDLRAEAAVEDPLALTELVLAFENPEDRVLEGTFRITLPQGASLSRFAMKVGGAWQEGEVVEKQQARRVYEDFLHRKQDPALLEQGSGNEFSARVFPIPARGRKEIRIAYTQVLETGAPYVLPLRGLPELGVLDVKVTATGARGVRGSYGIAKQRFMPAEDFVVAGKELPRSPGLRSGELMLARVVPFTSSRPDPIRSAVFLVDTSASRALGLAEQTKLLRKTLALLPPDAHVTVACFDQEVVQIHDGTAGAFGDKQADAILARGALGASDVEAALAWAGTKAKDAKANRIVLLGDGVATAGEIDAQKLKSKVEALRGAGIERIDAVAIGGIRDDGFLRGVVRGVLDKDGAVLDAALGGEAIARRLSEATSSGVPVKVEGATWSWPETLDGLQAGDEVMVYAEVDAQKPVKITVGTQELAPDLRSAERPLVERAWAQAKITSLTEAPKDDPAKTKHDIVALSTRHRVLSAHTAMLVLETDQDYARFGLDRNATVDILTVQDGRVALTQSRRRWEDGVERKGSDQKREEASKQAVRPSPRPSRPSDSDDVPRTATANAQAPAAPPPPAAEAAPAPAASAAIGGRQDDNLWGNADGDAFGAGGLGLSGVGEGGGGAGDLRIGGGGGVIAPGRGGQGLGGLGGGSHGAPSGAVAPSPEPQQEAPRARPMATATASPLAQGAGRRAPPSVVATAPSTPSSDAQVRPGAMVVERGMPDDVAQRTVRSATPMVRACYVGALAGDASLRGRIEVRIAVDAAGAVSDVVALSGPSNPGLRSCIQASFRSLHFPATSGDASLRATFDLVPSSGATPPDAWAQGPNVGNVPKALPYEGRFKVVMEKLHAGEKESALAEADRWRADAPGDVLALVAFGEALEAKGDLTTAARAYGSILELFASRADSRRFAGERLERLDHAGARKLAIDTYGKAAEQRPDHPASHRLYAFALLKNGQHEKAFEALEKGVKRSYPPGRFAGVDRILREDLALVAAAWTKADPKRGAEIARRLHAAGGTEESGPSLRFVLNWETDANDVDFHIHDGRGGHAYYGNRTLPSGGELYADVTTGYGPECFTIRGAREGRAHPYVLQAHYYSRGPMGYGMGKLQIVEHDGRGGLTFEERPFVVMVDRGYVDLGTVDRDRSKQVASK